MLTIRHTRGTHFQVDGAAGILATANVPSPWAPPRGNTDEPLRGALQWYFEDYFRSPGPASETRARGVEAAVRAWGEMAYDRLFGRAAAGAELHGARAAGGWPLRIEAGDAGILSWPWEALRSPDEPAPFGIHALMERSVSGVPGAVTPLDVRAKTLRVLLVSPRRRDLDVDYRAVSGPLVRAVRGLPVAIELLRPATYASLAQALERKPDVLHFDGHGSPNALWFEDGRGGLEAVPASTLAMLLHGRRIPIVVLNACRSAEFADTSVYSGVATALLRGNVGSVVAMSHVLHRDGASTFVPAFYASLARTGSVAAAATAGRFEMLQSPWRFGVRRDVQLDDFLLPVLYQRSAASSPVPSLLAGRPPRVSGPAVFGRDDVVLALERGLASDVPALFLLGEELSGKTLLAADLELWLACTGFPRAITSVELGACRTARELLNRMGLPLGQAFFSKAPQEKLAALAGSRAMWLLDGAEATLGPELVAPLVALLHLVRGGPRILLTGRAIPAWLPPRLAWTVTLRPFEGVQRWDFVERVLRRHGLDAHLGDPHLAPLVDDLAGNPGVMSDLLPRLARRPALSLRAEWAAARRASPTLRGALALLP